MALVIEQCSDRSCSSSNAPGKVQYGDALAKRQVAGAESFRRLLAAQPDPQFGQRDSSDVEAAMLHETVLHCPMVLEVGGANVGVQKKAHGWGSIFGMFIGLPRKRDNVSSKSASSSGVISAHAPAASRSASAGSRIRC